MKVSIAPGTAFAVSGACAALVSGIPKPLLGIGFGFPIAAALSLNGARGTLAYLHVPLSDADDPLSAAAVARTLEKMKMGAAVVVGIMAIVFAGVAVLTSTAATR